MHFCLVKIPNTIAAINIAVELRKLWMEKLTTRYVRLYWFLYYSSSTRNGIHGSQAVVISLLVPIKHENNEEICGFSDAELWSHFHVMSSLLMELVN